MYIYLLVGIEYTEDNLKEIPTTSVVSQENRSISPTNPINPTNLNYTTPLKRKRKTSLALNKNVDSRDRNLMLSIMKKNRDIDNALKNIKVKIDNIKTTLCKVKTKLDRVEIILNKQCIKLNIIINSIKDKNHITLC